MPAAAGSRAGDALHPGRPHLHFAYRGVVPANGRGDHRPAWFGCWLVDEGWAEIHVAGSPTLRAEAGEWLLCPPVLRRRQEFAPGTHIASIAFRMPSPEGLDLAAGLPLVLAGRRAAALTGPANVLIERWCETRDAHGDRQARRPLALVEWVAVQQALATFIDAWLAARGVALPHQVRDQRVRMALAVLAAQVRMGAVPYAALERRTGLGRVQIDRLFKRLLGSSPKAELNRLCLERVLDRLADPTLPIKRIAAELRFTDSSHLCRWFSERVGISPERYRREA